MVATMETPNRLSSIESLHDSEVVMSLELLNTFATFGTFFVISATAIAAVIQLRHLRASNQIAAFQNLQDDLNAPGFRDALHYIYNDLQVKLQDPAFRYTCAYPSARTEADQEAWVKVNIIGSYFEHMGSMLNGGLLDSALVLGNWSRNAVAIWKALEPIIALMRRVDGTTVYENFEYLVVRSREWTTGHPSGMYPRGVQRIELDDPWREEDKRYEAQQQPNLPE